MDIPDVMRQLALFGTGITLALAVGAASSGSAVAATPGNQTPPTIRGTAREGAVLQADQGRWAGGSGTSFAFQWRRCQPDGTGCVDIPTATDRLYTPRADDLAHALVVVVTARNRDGAATATSAPTGAVAALPAQAPHAAVPPSIAGSAAIGQTLKATAGTWTGAAPLRFSFRWRRCDPTGGACTDTRGADSSHRVSDADAGHVLRVLVTATNAAGTSASLSGPSPLVALPKKPISTSPPGIAGVPQQGKSLTGSRGAWSNSPTGFDYRWYRCAAAGDRCSTVGRGTTYTLSAADIGHTIRFAVRARNRAGVSTVVSPPTAVVAAAPAPKVSQPANTSPPAISGTAQAGHTLTATRGAWSGNPTDFDYRWRRCDRNGNDCDGISGADSTTYLLTASDVGHTLRFRVEARNAGGTSSATSAPTAVVIAAAAPGNTFPPTISGTPEQGKALTGHRGGWSRDPSGYEYAWLRCDRTGNSCAAIPGANGTTYTLVAADVGNTVRFRVTAANSAGRSTAASVPTAVVRVPAAPPPPPPPPRPNGCPPRASINQPASVAGIAPPARLLVDTLRAQPRTVTGGTHVLVVRFHVTSTCGGPVQGALVYATATPYNQFSIPPEATTDAAGWATLVFRRLRGFPVSSRQQLIAMFVRARKPGENVLGGVSTRRLVSIPVRLR